MWSLLTRPAFRVPHSEPDPSGRVGSHLGWLALLCLCAFDLTYGIARAQSSSLDAATAAFNATRWQDAEQLLRAYLASHTDSADAHYLLASTLFHEDRPLDSIAEYNSAAHLRKPGAADLKGVALDYVIAHDYRSADKWMTAALSLDAEDGDAWYALGRIRYSEEEFAEAVDAFKEALRHMPESVKTENNLGLALEGLYQPEQAAAAYRQAIEWQKDSLHPSEQPFLNLGKLLMDGAQTEAAATLLRRAEQLSPNEEEPHLGLGKLYSKQGDLKTAQDELQQAVAIAPNDVAAHFMLGRIYRNEGLVNQADLEFARVEQLNRADSSKP
jgi:Tfp pilus assembly protein PilF